MPGAMRKMGVYLGLVEGDDPYIDDEDPYERMPSRQAEGGAELRHGRASELAAAAPREWRGEGEATARYESSGHYVPEYAEVEAPSYRITTLHPRTYNEARTIGEHFRSSTPVIMNLSEMDDSDAKRLVDFAAGLTFGLHGRIERVTSKVFLLSPHNVTVTAQDKARIAESGFFNQS
ncbi:MAG TPA: cell division protein SepF [Jatrophihabitantaceae bacterium]|jgi:cell division inhibitor SepF|nr:cell division protein SepF [Jatrophihabitantaceae bacterium]